MKTKVKATFISVVLCGIVSTGGCGQTEWKVQREAKPLEISSNERDLAWSQVIDVLREHHFQIDFKNRRSGLITTEPEVSQQWFEFWRADAQGWNQWLESSLHTIRRKVEVKFRDQNGTYLIDVKVRVQRKSRPQRQVTTSSGAIQIFREEMPLYTGEQVPPGETTQWVDLGEDPRFENYLLNRISRRLTVSETPDKPQDKKKS